jgi:hypothetical protein
MRSCLSACAFVSRRLNLMLQVNNTPAWLGRCLCEKDRCSNHGKRRPGAARRRLAAAHLELLGSFPLTPPVGRQGYFFCSSPITGEGVGLDDRPGGGVWFWPERL